MGFCMWEPLSSEHLSSHRTFRPSYLSCCYRRCVAHLHLSTSTTSSVTAPSRLRADFAPISSLNFLIDGVNAGVCIKYDLCIRVEACPACVSARAQSSWCVQVSCYSIMKVGGMSRFCVCGRLKPQRTLYMSALITVCISSSLSVSVLHFTNICLSACSISATDQNVQQLSLLFSTSSHYFCPMTQELF